MKYLEPADLVVALLTGRDVDSGTAAEIGYAFRARKKKLIRNGWGLQVDC